MKAKVYQENRPERRYFLKMAGVAVTVFVIHLSIVLPALAAPVAPLTLDPRTIPKYVNQLTGSPPVYLPEYVDPITGAEYYTVDMTAFTQQVLPATDALGNPTGFGQTSVWGYGGFTTAGVISNQPGPSFEATKGVPIYVRYQNKITGPHMFPVDPTLHWANPNGVPMFMPIMPGDPPFPSYPPGFDGTQGYPAGEFWNAQSPVPLVPHLHGGEVQSTSDGHPEAWFTSTGAQGMAYNTALTTWHDGTSILPSEAVFYYPNAQPPTTLWYHDHGLGITRINVMSGLAGFYLLRDPLDPLELQNMLPKGNYETPLAIQDRTFKLTDPNTGHTDFWFPTVGLDPMVHPYWQPEFFGDTIMVNGMVWPNLNVEQALYRFRLLDGSNARFYTLWFQVKPLNPLLNPPPLTFYQIGTDGGYLSAPVPLTRLTIAPGERADIVVDFSMLSPGDRVIIRNSANAPFPSGASPDPKTVGQIMQLTVTGPLSDPTQPITIPATLPSTIPVLTPNTPSRTLTLIEKMGMLGPTEIFLDGQRWAGNPIQPISETPSVGSTQDWYIVNPTADTHPIHLHLVQFQLVSRQSFNVGKYLADWMLLNGVDPVTMAGLPLNQPTVNVPSLTPYLKGKPAGPAPNERGWKDTIQMNPGEVTVIRVRFAPLDVGLPGKPAYDPTINQYPFDPTTDPGYVWHCHILDHEDNEMMRPYKVVAP